MLIKSSTYFNFDVDLNMYPRFVMGTQEELVCLFIMAEEYTERFSRGLTKPKESCHHSTYKYELIDNREYISTDYVNGIEPIDIFGSDFKGIVQFYHANNKVYYLREDELRYKTVSKINYAVFEQALLLTNVKFYVEILYDTNRYYYIDTRYYLNTWRCSTNVGNNISFSAKVLYDDYIRCNTEPKEGTSEQVPIIEMIEIGTKDNTCKIHKILVDHDPILKYANINTDSQSIIFTNFTFDVIKLYVDYLYLGRKAVRNVIKYDINSKTYNYNIHELLSFADFVTDTNDSDNFLNTIVETNNIRNYCWLIYRYKDKISKSYYDEHIKITSNLSDLLDKIAPFLINKDVHYVGGPKSQISIPILYLQTASGNKLYFIHTTANELMFLNFGNPDPKEIAQFYETFSNFKVKMIGSKSIDTEFITSKMHPYDLETMVLLQSV